MYILMLVFMIVFFSHNISNKAMKEFCEDKLRLSFLDIQLPQYFL